MAYRKASVWAALALAIGIGGAQASSLDGQETYDLLFRQGTLDQVEPEMRLVYGRAVSNALKPEAAERDTGDVVLSIEQRGEAELAMLRLEKDGKHRGLGRFPASVGNPMIMFFYESAVRDMAEAAGGSPYYIRNRVKDSLIQPSEVETGEAEYDGRTVKTQTVRLYPFEGDPNVARMQGFGDLVLTVTMSEEVPGWYLALTAEAGEVYRSELSFERLEEVAQ